MTGTSTEKAVKAVKEWGARNRRHPRIVDRSAGGKERNFASLTSYDYRSVFTLDQVLADAPAAAHAR